MVVRPQLSDERFDEAGAGAGVVERRDYARDISFAPEPIETTREGYNVYRGVAGFADVVLDYTAEFGTRELVPAEEALSDRALKTLVGKAFTIPGHPPRNLTPKTTRQWMKGTVRSAERRDGDEGPELVVEVIVMDEEADRLIQSGVVAQLSLGRYCGRDKTPGTLKGQAYDERQRDFHYNHLAGVIRARSRTPGGAVARFDEDTPMDEIEFTLPDGTVVKIPKALAAYIESLKGETDDEKTPPAPPAGEGDDKPRMDEAAIAAMIGKAIDAKLKPLAERLDNMPAAIRGDLSSYAELRAQAEPILTDAKVEHRFDGDAFATKAAVCKAVFGDDDADVAAAEKATDEARMDGLYKGAVREYSRRGEHVAGQLGSLTGKRKGAGAGDEERNDAAAKSEAKATLKAAGLF